MGNILYGKQTLNNNNDLPIIAPEQPGALLQQNTENPINGPEKQNRKVRNQNLGLLDQ